MSSLGLISALKEASKEAAAAPPSPPLSAQTPPPLSAQTLPTPSEQTPSKINNLLAARQAASATPLPPPIRPTNILDDTRKESAEKALPPPEFIPLKIRHPKHESIYPEPKMKVDCPDNNDPRSTVKQANALKPDFAGAL